MNQAGIGTISLRIEGISMEETRRYQEIINILILNGAFNIKGGKVILNFDAEGTLREIELNYKKYKR